jgi:uncharacterized protein YciI
VTSETVLQHFLVTEAPGPEWDRSKPRREQPGWDAHAAFVDSLADQGVVVLGGPLGDPDYGPALLVVAAENEDEVRKHLADDPWIGTILTIESIEPWSIWIGALPS